MAGPGKAPAHAGVIATLLLAAASMTPGAALAQAGGAPPQGAGVNNPSATPTPGAAAASLDDRFAIGGQFTLTGQSNFAFSSPFRGPNSLNPTFNGRETVDATLYAGLRPWRGAEIWLNPEIDQGFGLTNTLGVAGFLSGEAYKVGAVEPYIRLQRLFLRQTFDLGGGEDNADADINAFAMPRTAHRLVITAGKMSVGDIFDANRYAHDPRQDFLNWGLIDTGTFDYAADAWGYSYGVAGEWYTGAWVLRLGGYAMSKVPNGQALGGNFAQYQVDAELERRYRLFGQDGKVKVTAFDSRARFGDFADAIRLAQADGGVPNVLDVRRYRSHAGIGVSVEQPVTADAGLFLRAGYADGHQQAYEFTDIDRTLAGGVSVQGKRWGRPDDTFGLAGEINAISQDFRAYLAAGGLGILIGDGQLPSYGTERILETYYSLKATDWAHVSFDYQYVDNPGYDPARGPVSVIAVRLHLQNIGFWR